MNITRCLLLTAVALFVAFGAAVPAIAETHQQDTVAITAAVAATDAAAAKEDASGVVASYAADFTNFDVHGNETAHSKAEAQTQMAMLFSRATNVVSKSVITSIVYDKVGATVFVTGDGSFNITVNGQAHVVTIHGTYKDYWVQSQGTWLEEKSTSLTETGTVDGKAMGG